MIQTTLFARSLSNFACKLFMMRGGTILIVGHGVKGQDQLWPLARGCHALRCLVTLKMHSMTFPATSEGCQKVKKKKIRNISF